MVYMGCNVHISGAWEGTYSRSVHILYMYAGLKCVHDSGGKGCKCEYLGQQ